MIIRFGLYVCGQVGEKEKCCISNKMLLCKDDVADRSGKGKVKKDDV